MELKINLGSREDIEAAQSLLETILRATRPPLTEADALADLNGTPRPDNPSVPRAPDGTRLDGAGLPPVVSSPLAHAPSTAGATALPTAPGAAQGSLIPGLVPQPPAQSGPSAAAPSAPVPPQPPALDVDAKGLPWDERIHASTKARNKDNTWKAKRNVEVTTVATVEAELRARMANVGAPNAAALGADAAKLAGLGMDPLSGQPLPPGPPAVDAADPAAVFGAAPFVPPGAASAPAVPAAPSVAADPVTFEQLMMTLSPLVVAGKLPPTASNQACVANGLANVAALQTAPQFVPLVFATVKQIYPAAFA